MPGQLRLNSRRLGSSNAKEGLSGKDLAVVAMNENVDKGASEDEHFLKNSVLYKEFLAEREEVLKHKWIESEKAGADIGFEKALLDWIVKHRSNWRERRARETRPTKASA
jgi:hypothetical protein